DIEGSATGPSTFPSGLNSLVAVLMSFLVRLSGADSTLMPLPMAPGVLSAPDSLTKKDISTATKLLRPLGKVEGPVAEPSISAVTGVSGSGPAYIFLLVEALAEAGEAAGLKPELARTLARETLVGSARLLEATGDPARDLRKAVTSKGGTTEAALDVLMRGDGIPSLLREAVRAAADRERALSSGK
ncbi:MAG: pyrroline-5-carboxylate reductase dimerization domain-containing protein, partial [Pseudomonadota bacterium]